MPISTHILDIALGLPAVAVPVALSIYEADTWLTLNTTVTDAEGRCINLLPPDRELSPAIYRIRFDTRAYYERIAVCGLHPYVEIAFETLPGQRHYHIPLLLTAHSYTTYRGS